MSDQQASFLLFAESVPHLGTVIAVWTVQQFRTGGYPVTIAEVACLSVLGREMTIHSQSTYKLSSHESVVKPLAVYCQRHVKDVFNNVLLERCPGQSVLPIVYESATNIPEFFRNFTSIGIGAEQIQEVCTHRRHLEAALGCIPRFTGKWSEDT